MTNSTVPVNIKTSQDKIVKPLKEEESKPVKPAPFLVLAVILGVVSGFLFFTSLGKANISLSKDKSSITNVSSGTTVGSTSTKDFPDCTEGQLAVNDGKITDEGSHMLIRPGGTSQTVYLTSSVLDLNQFVGKNVQVCGQTYQGQKAGWLMDVGRVTIK